MKCSNCGKENNNGALFCSVCGKALVEEPINLDLRQINTPASARQVHIVKVNTAKKNAVENENKKPESLKEEKEASSVQTEQEDGGKDATSISSSENTTQIPTDNAEKSDYAENAIKQEQNDGSETAGPPVPDAPYYPDKSYAPMRKRDWLAVTILSSIPFVNIIMLFVWAFGARVNKSKKSYAQLQLIILAVLIIVCVAAVFIYTAVFGVNPLKKLPFIKPL